MPHTELADLFVLNVRTMTWTKHTTDAAPPARQLHSACALQGNMVVFGGYSKNKRMNDLHIFSLGMFPPPACALQGNVVVFGGYLKNKDERFAYLQFRYLSKLVPFSDFECHFRNF